MAEIDGNRLVHGAHVIIAHMVRLHPHTDCMNAPVPMTGAWFKRE